MEQDENINYEEAINTLLDACNDFKSTISALEEENRFLSKLIIDNNLGNLAEEMRALKIKMKKIQAEAEKNLALANRIREEYHRANTDLELQQMMFAKFVNEKAEEKMKDEINRQKNNNDKTFKILVISSIANLILIISLLILFLR